MAKFPKYIFAVLQHPVKNYVFLGCYTTSQ
jgi:hypothetical protein